MAMVSFLLLLVSLLGITNVASQPRNCTRLLDVIAVVDGSDSIKESDFVKLKNAVIKLAEGLNLGSGSQRFGAVVFSSTVSDTAPLSSDINSLKSEISTFVHPRDGTATDKGILTMKGMFEEDSRNRVPQVGIIITDGISKNPGATQIAANAAKALGIKLIAVGIGAEVNTTELDGIASTSDDVKEISNFDELQAALTSLVYKLCIVDGGWSSWSVPTRGSCSATCGKGSVTLTSSRTCNNPPPENGGKDCEGSLTKTTSEDCKKQDCPDNPCNGCRYKNGVGFMPDPSDCRNYLQCYLKGEKYIVMPCAAGTYWKQEDLTCTRSRDKCGSEKTDEYEPSDESSKSGCDGRRRPVDGNNTVYDEEVPGFEWITRPCAPGTVYDSNTCICVHGGTVVLGCKPQVYIPFTGDATDHSGYSVTIENNGVKITSLNQGRFDYNTGLRINRFSNMDFRQTLVIDFLLHKGENSANQQAIVTNADCGEAGSIYIIQRNSNVDFQVVNKAGVTNTLSLPYATPSNGLARVRLTILDGIMTAEVNGKKKTRDFKGDIGKSHCAIQIGRGTSYDNFRGFIDEFRLYICKP